MRCLSWNAVEFVRTKCVFEQQGLTKRKISITGNGKQSLPMRKVIRSNRQMQQTKKEIDDPYDTRKAHSEIREAKRFKKL